MRERLPWVRGVLPDQPIRRAALTANLLGVFFHQLGPSQVWRVFGCGLRIRAPGASTLGYPGLTIVCGQPVADGEERGAITNPTLLASVLAPLTEARERGEAWRCSQNIPTLQHYLLLSPEGPYVEAFQRLTERSWRYTTHGPGSTLNLLGATLHVDELYANLPDDPET